MNINVDKGSIYTAQNTLRKTVIIVNQARDKLNKARESLSASGQDRKSRDLLNDVNSKLDVLHKAVEQMKKSYNNLSILYAAICEYINENG